MTITDTTIDTYQLWIDGERRPAKGGATFTRESPYTGEVVSQYANADVDDAEAALAVGRRAFDDGRWTKTPMRTRHDVLVRSAELLRERADLIAHRVALEAGKPLHLTRAEIETSARALEFFAGAALANEGSALSDRVPGSFGMILRDPVGVVSIVTAWNFPVAQIVQKVAAAFAAGCTVVIKPSHLCSAPAVLLAEIFHDAGLPGGVFNVVTSEFDRGARVGQVLSASTQANMVAFTGSTVAGQAIMRAAATNTKRLLLELGGKSANIVFDDAPFEAAARTAITAFTTISGQQCSAGGRLLVQRGIHKKLVDALKVYVRDQKLGDPLDSTTTMGPLVNQAQLDRVLGYVDIGKEVGDLVVGGGQPDVDSPVNFFIEPTIFDNVSNDSRLAREEVFGPVLAIIPFDTEEEAIALANDNDYGLAGGVWTQSLDRALRVTKAIRTGKFFVNAYNTAGLDDMPGGGVKSSGFGREFGLPGLQEFQTLKSVQIKLQDATS